MKESQVRALADAYLAGHCPWDHDHEEFDISMSTAMAMPTMVTPCEHAGPWTTMVHLVVWFMAGFALATILFRS